jgi:hypothetical protein
VPHGALNRHEGLAIGVALLVASLLVFYIGAR